VSNANGPEENRMKLHANARTCPKSRQLLVDRIDAGWSVMEAAAAAGITDRTARRWMPASWSTSMLRSSRRCGVRGHRAVTMMWTPHTRMYCGHMWAGGQTGRSEARSSVRPGATAL
jgi:hypothetical protein